MASPIVWRERSANVAPKLPKEFLGSKGLANPFEPKNSLGNFGATFADLSLQTIGLAIFIFIFTIAVFGWKLLRHIGLGRIWLRITCLIIG